MKFVSRADWHARPRKSRQSLNAAGGGVAIHWEGPHLGIKSHAECDDRVRSIQAFHMDSRGWADIAYSVVVCPHGYVFEARGLRTRTAAQGTNDGNDRYYAACYLGGEGDPLTPEGKQGLTDAIHWLREQGGAGLDVQPHRHFHSTGCPGDALAAWVKAKGYNAPPLPPAKAQPAPPAKPTPAPAPVQDPKPVQENKMDLSLLYRPTGGSAVFALTSDGMRVWVDGAWYAALRKAGKAGPIIDLAKESNVFSLPVIGRDPGLG